MKKKKKFKYILLLYIYRKTIKIKLIINNKYIRYIKIKRKKILKLP